MILSILFLLLTPFVLFEKYKFEYYLLGSLIVFGTQDLSPTKIIFIVTCLFANIFAFYGLVNSAGNSNHNHKLALKIGNNLSFLIFFVILLAFISSQKNGIIFNDFIRSNSHLLLFVSGIYISLEAGLEKTKNQLISLLLLVGVLSTITFTYKWLQIRGIFSFASQRIGFDADALIYLGFAFALGLLFTSTRKAAYSFTIVTFIIGCVFLTLTRTSLFLLLTITLLVLFLNRIKFKYLLTISSVFMVFLATINILNQNFSNNSSFVNRSNYIFGSLFKFGLASDQSVALRIAQGKLAKSIWDTNIVFGIGALPPNLYLDNILATNAQYGIIGCVLLTFAVLIIFRYVFTFAKFDMHVRNSGIAFLFTLIPATLMYNWPANKSFFLAFNILLAVCYPVTGGDSKKPNGSFKQVHLRGIYSGK